MTGGPRRTCVGCRQVRPKATLVRLVGGEDGQVRVDRGGESVGRGAYVCPTVDCLDKALIASRLVHALKRASQPPLEGAIVILEQWRRR